MAWCFTTRTSVAAVLGTNPYIPAAYGLSGLGWSAHFWGSVQVCGISSANAFYQAIIFLLLFQRGGLALLTGPPGVGKTATIRVLAREMKLDLHEWSNPVTNNSSVDWEKRTSYSYGGKVALILENKKLFRCGKFHH